MSKKPQSEAREEVIKRLMELGGAAAVLEMRHHVLGNLDKDLTKAARELRQRRMLKSITCSGAYRYGEPLSVVEQARLDAARARSHYGNTFYVLADTLGEEI